MVLAGCSATMIDFEKPHHTSSGFRNHPPVDRPGLFDFLKWQWERPDYDFEGVLAAPLPSVAPDLAYLNGNPGTNSVTWIGHATLLVQLGGLNILTDPQFSERASPVQWTGPKRVNPPAIPIDDLPRIDIVLISHDHYDSLDADSVEALRGRPGGERTVFYVPLGLKGWLNDRGVERVVELDWWDQARQGSTEVTAVPVQYWSQRWLLRTNRTLWAGFVVRTPAGRFFFAGDSAYTQHFQSIGEKYGPFDLAAIPIGAYAPRWFMRTMHMNPEESVKVHRDVRARLSVAMHWGTFRLTDEPLDEPPRLLARARATAGLRNDEFVVLMHGETLRFAGSNPHADARGNPAAP
jgi:L-ascorbate metabolism protein UlaG (beta-lactamase superfamily)